ncbi:serine hydrolase [Amnibacterium sp. CER49]|uniref:serine hydrolase domain-containing protein n=1 Tax=Amnibacterium sp. CER49 TaxID=3039161 RepID=UPI00244897F3|nr:serine hydrolase [Amnibacterium sp. CER49]MDH2444232.1 serine hydrolase [Amnibacterium sp. CER49]
MTVPRLPRSTPGEQGVDPAGLLALLDALEGDPAIEPHGLMVLRHGHVVAEGWWRPYTAERLHLYYSLSKTFTITALGFAIAEGLVGLDDPVADHFPEFAAELPERSRGILVRHVAAMASGHRGEQLELALQTDAAEPVRGFLLNPPEEEPGSVFAYSQPCTYAIATIVQRESGATLVDYLRPRLLDPLGIGPVGWQQFPAGRDVGFTGLHAPTEAAAKLGQVYLDEGRWQGRQLLPEGWAEQVRTKHVDTPDEESVDWAQGYGFQVWRSRHGYRADGAFGQFSLVIPEHDAVVAITEATETAQVVLDAVWEHLLPAFSDGPVDSPLEEPLRRRLAALELPASGGEARPRGGRGEGRYRPAHADAAFSAVVLEPGVEGWTATVEAGADRVALPIGRPGWTVVEGGDGQAPLAVSGGFEGDELLLDLVFLEAPHRLRLQLAAGGDTFRTAWRPAPLGLLPQESALRLGAPLPLR